MTAAIRILLKKSLFRFIVKTPCYDRPAIRALVLARAFARSGRSPNIALTHLLSGVVAGSRRPCAQVSVPTVRQLRDYSGSWTLEAKCVLARAGRCAKQRGASTTQPEICTHLHAYNGNQVLLEWHDAFDAPLKISKSIPEERIIVCPQKGGALGLPEGLGFATGSQPSCPAIAKRPRE